MLKGEEEPWLQASLPVTDARFKQEMLSESKYVFVETGSDYYGYARLGPRDSVEPLSTGTTRDSDELNHGMLRKTDELIHDLGRLRKSDKPFIKQEALEVDHWQSPGQCELIELEAGDRDSIAGRCVESVCGSSPHHDGP